MLNINLSSPGRFGFYVDYSELSTTGMHTFYVTRTHGTSGVVAVDFDSFGDAHTTASGIISFADGQAGIKSFTVAVPTKADAGDHRIYAQLSNPTNGAVLHNGTKTIAYGIIDDGTIAIDASAVFFDAGAGVNGTGTQASPYDNIYDAITNVGSKRYIYGKGTTIPDGTDTTNRNGGGGDPKCISVPAGRSGESTRLYIQVWPGYTFTVDGTGSRDIVGFDGHGAGFNYHTFRKIAFTNLDCSDVAGYCEQAGVGYFEGNQVGVNLEYITGDNLNGNTNIALYQPYDMDSSKIWRCTANNIQVNGDNNDQNASGLLEYYTANNLSVQRCEVTNSYVGLHFKRPVAGHVCPVVRFNIIKSSKGIKFGFGSSGHEVNYAVIQNNLFKDCTTLAGIEVTGTSATGNEDNVISNNVFDNCGEGDNGAIRINDSYKYKIYNNIFLDCRKMWDIPEDVDLYQSDKTRNVIEYANYNHDFGTTYVRYEYLSILYETSSALNSFDSNLAGNDSTGDPLFNDPSNDDYTLQNGSICIANGVSGSNQGIYLTGIEKLGVSDTIGIRVPSPPTGLTIS
jgi:hypothetical protein